MKDSPIVSNYLNQFLNYDETFLRDVYPFLPKDRKFSLWLNLLTFDHRECLYHNPLDKFTPENYQKWKSIEKDFDFFLDTIIIEYLEMFFPFDDSKFTDIGAEVNKRLERIEKK